MTDKEKLDAVRAEIHRLVDVRGYDRGMANDLFAFMDSLPNEPVSEDLEKVFDKYSEGIESVYSNDMFDRGDITRACKFGAQCQKERDVKKIETAIDFSFHGGRCQKEEEMLKNAIDANCFGFQGDALFSFKLPADKYLVGSKVKVFVIKED